MSRFGVALQRLRQVLKEDALFSTKQAVIEQHSSDESLKRLLPPLAVCFPKKFVLLLFHFFISFYYLNSNFISITKKFFIVFLIVYAMHK